MQLNVNLHNREKKIVILDDNTTALELIKKLELTPDEVIIIRDNYPIPVDEKLYDNDEVKIIKVASGG